MPTSTNDDPTAAGATNVFLTQRAATAPYRREEVSIQGDENPLKALGFDSAGILRTLSAAEMIASDPEAAKEALGYGPDASIGLDDMEALDQGKVIGRKSTGTGTPEAVTVAEMIALDPAAAQAALGPISENPFTSVDTEAEFDAALAAGRSIHVRGEGTDGVVALTTQKSITTDHQQIIGPGELRFTLPGANPRGITVHADDVTLSNFELTSTQALASNTCYGIALAEGAEDHGHRMKLLDLHIHNWKRCISKDGSSGTSSQEDVVIERLRAHSAKEYVVYLNFGLTRLRMRDCVLLGWLEGDPHVTTDNAMYGGGNWRDCSFESCHFGNVGRMGFEATTPDYSYAHDRTRLNWCRAENCGSMGFSMGFVTSGIFSQCKAWNVVQCGFEIGGRVPGHPADLGLGGKRAQAIIDSCEVDTVSRASAGVYGFSLDGAIDTTIRGACKIANITSSHPQGACAIGMTDCERCSVQGVIMEDCGHKFLYCTSAYLPNTTGFHEFSNNVFRNPGGSPDGTSHHAIYIHNQPASVKNNTVYQKTGTTFGYSSVTYAPCNVYCDGVAVANSPPPAPDPIPVAFTGSNIIVPA